MPSFEETQSMSQIQGVIPSTLEKLEQMKSDPEVRTAVAAYLYQSVYYEVIA